MNNSFKDFWNPVFLAIAAFIFYAVFAAGSISEALKILNLKVYLSVLCVAGSIGFLNVLRKR